MTFRLEAEVLHMPFRDPFKIARNEDSEASQTVLTMLRRDDDEGLGECFPVPYYGETVETTEAVLPRLTSALDELGPLPSDRDAALAWLDRSALLMDDVLGNHGGAKGGLDMALHDMAGKALGLPVWELIGTSDQLPPTDYSLGIDDPATVAERARRVAHFPALKIKVGGPHDIETLEAVRAVFNGPIRVDANTGWLKHEAMRVVRAVRDIDVYIEQPCLSYEDCLSVRRHTDHPFVLDENIDGLTPLLRGFTDLAMDVVNIKISKFICTGKIFFQAMSILVNNTILGKCSTNINADNNLCHIL